MTPVPGVPVLGVVVPVHDEQEHLAGCLRALGRARRRLGARAAVRTVVALDDCSDASAAVARRAGVETTVLAARRVGEARRAGCDALLAHGPTPQWIATTDADSLVAPAWLAAQLAALAGGHDALVGTVAVADWSGYPPALVRRYRDSYDGSGDPHPHVHGANLGVATAAYLAVGGFPTLRTGEDVALVAALDAGGHRVLRTRDVPVVTSSRRRGRAVAGFAAHLAHLAQLAEA